jgi:hypothetical protein
MTRRWNRAASIVNGLAALLLVVNTASYSYYLRHHDRAPGFDWGYTHERWYGILRDDALVALILALLASAVWFHHQIARYIDAISVAPKLCYSYVYFVFGAISHDLTLQLVAVLIFVSILTIPIYWRQKPTSAG